MSKPLKEFIASLPQEEQQAIRDITRELVIEEITNHQGSSLDDFLKEQGIYDECEAEASRRVEEWKKLSLEEKVEYAKKLLDLLR